MRNLYGSPHRPLVILNRRLRTCTPIQHGYVYIVPRSFLRQDDSRGTKVNGLYANDIHNRLGLLNSEILPSSGRQQGRKEDGGPVSQCYL
ncbi:hypothetical protein [Sphingobacterium mizutaii]|uniref:hypothetical protein n=1 Tax=Sphingobacterium mizutaii TaxID=1010 RepID=UPI00162660F7|nr:hypothetical protein [Sphingobacterium mizutaii]